MLICDTHADTLYKLAVPDRAAGAPLEVLGLVLSPGSP